MAESFTATTGKHLVIKTSADVDRYLEVIRAAAARTQAWALAQSSDPLDFLRQMKFHEVGFHPVAGHRLNLMEQLNQTWTYAVALEASRKLLELHPDAGGFNVAPGAHMALPLDIMSVVPGLVGAETFAATSPDSNNKLNKDRAKLAARPEQHRYVFFSTPQFNETARIPRYERNGVQVWSVAI